MSDIHAEKFLVICKVGRNYFCSDVEDFSQKVSMSYSKADIRALLTCTQIFFISFFCLCDLTLTKEPDVVF